MPRLPYVPAEIDEPAELVGAIRARRGGPLLNLDRMLLHSPPLARGWNAFLAAVRTELGVDDKLRELAVCAVALLNHVEYELHHHVGPFLAAGGTRAQLDALRHGLGADDGKGPFDETERAILRLTLEMTRDVSVHDSTLEAVRAVLGDRGTVELVAIIATYNMVSRFLSALGVEPE